MIYCDIHTHQQAVRPEDFAVVSVDLRNPALPAGFLPDEKGDTRFSVGIHPWQPDGHLMDKVREYAAMPSVAAIGETGLDKNAADFARQRQLFEDHVRIAETYGKPLIIHCVKAWDELLQIRKSANPTTPWIVHGFRGNGRLAKQLLTAGLYLSFGAYCRPDALNAAWEKGRLLAETDDKVIDIRDVYSRISAGLNISGEILADAVEALFRSLICT
jgi:TatD DNase family protein